MNAVTKVSAKGQVVIPKDVRDRLRWEVGTKLEVIDGPAGVMLRSSPESPRKKLSFDEGLAQMRATIKYDGPYYTDADWNAAIDEMFRQGKDVTV